MVLILINNNFNLLSIQTTARQYNTIAKKQEIEEAYSTFTKTMPRLLIQKENIHYGTILSIIIFDFLRDTVQWDWVSHKLSHVNDSANIIL